MHELVRVTLEICLLVVGMSMTAAIAGVVVFMLYIFWKITQDKFQ